MALENKEQIYTEKSTLKNWFSSKLKPTQGQFWAWMDSYWHKGEKLPINTIDGLGEAVDGKAPLVHYHEHYATNDATSLSNENVLSWQQKLGVDDLDYVEIPTENATENSHPYVVVINDEGKSAKRNANDFGKVDTVNEIEPDENKNVNIGLDDVLNKGSITERTVSFKNGETQNFDVGLLKEGLLFRYNDPNEIKETTSSSDFSIGAYQNYYWVSSTGKNVVAASSVQMGFLGTQPDGQIIGFQFADRRNNVLRLVADTNTNTYETNSVKYPAKSGVNALISDIQAIFNQAVNWTNANQRFSGLVSKHNDATYNRLLGMDVNGNINEVGLPALTNEMSKSTDAQKDAYRLASRKSTETYSLGQSTILTINPLLIDNTKDYAQSITLIGSNLFVNNTDASARVTMQRLRDLNNNPISEAEVDITEKVTVLEFMPNMLNILSVFKNKPEGYYIFKVTHNGLTNLTSPELLITNNIEYLPITNFELVSKTAGVTSTTNGGISIPGSAIEQKFKSKSIFDIVGDVRGCVINLNIQIASLNTSNTMGVTTLGVNDESIDLFGSANVQAGLLFRTRNSIFEVMKLNNTTLFTNSSAAMYSFDVILLIKDGLWTLYSPTASSIIVSGNYVNMSKLSLFYSYSPIAAGYNTIIKINSINKL
ncbi:hypothetical protein [Empedobacter brevis]|uniref:hypothetical protein n=1 Tax=Empedobacter brevis TaxID=247 RepID=UPI0028A19F9F|nr:hypothetical protein [Empedobacter brevis]